MNQQEAPHAVSAVRYRLVLVCGLATTAAVLLVIYLLGTVGCHPMGWYANYVLPVGAILVGLGAGSGYGLASWFSGVKITKALLVMIVVLQLGGYFVAQYIEYKSLEVVHEDGSAASFAEYFDATTRSFAWEDKGKPGKPLGLWGYGLRALEIVGFVLGSLVVPIILRSRPYCEGCQMYFRRRELGLLPAGVVPRKIKKRDAEALAAHEQEQERAWEAGQDLLRALAGKAGEGDADGFRALLAPHEGNKKAYSKLSARIALSIDHCPGCCNGLLNAAVLRGQGNKIQRTALGPTPLAPEFVRAFLDPRGASRA